MTKMSFKNFMAAVAGVVMISTSASNVFAAEILSAPTDKMTKEANILPTPSAETPVAGFSRFLLNGIDYTTPVEVENNDAETVTEPAPEPVVFYGFENVSQMRMDIVNLAVSMQGTVSYHLGSKPDYNNDWAVGESLDCSGFVGYVYHAITGVNIGEGTWNQSTENIESGLGTYISHDELQPGDLAFIHDGRETVTYDENGNKKILSNHVGIYVGKDEAGNDLWCHCNAHDNTVAVNSVSYWNHYMHINIDGIDNIQ